MGQLVRHGAVVNRTPPAVIAVIEEPAVVVIIVQMIVCIVVVGIVAGVYLEIIDIIAVKNALLKIGTGQSGAPTRGSKVIIGRFALCVYIGIKVIHTYFRPLTACAVVPVPIVVAVRRYMIVYCAVK